MKLLDKLKNTFKLNKKLLLFFIILLIIGIISGSIFMAILKDTDKELISNYLNEFASNIKDNKINYFEGIKNCLFNNLLYILIIWILGMSVIGIPIVIIMYFYKSFILGFSISSIIFNFKVKGCLLSFATIFPHQILNFLIYIILTTYSIFFSIKMINSIINKKTLDFKKLMNRYIKVLLFSLIVITISIIIEVFITPLFIKLVINILNVI